MAYTKSDLARVDRAIAGAELEVQYNGRRVRYRSMDELRQAREVILSDLAKQGRGRSRNSYLRHGGKGL
jgi:hypothetical protein